MKRKTDGLFDKDASVLHIACLQRLARRFARHRKAKQKPDASFDARLLRSNKY
jgi:hypothetical protein